MGSNEGVANNSRRTRLYSIVASSIMTHQSYMKNMETRAKFLSDELHRIRIVYTPKHASWLNQIEILFGTLSKRLLKRLSAISTEELKCKIMAFIDYYNETMAKVYKWTYNGRPLIA